MTRSISILAALSLLALSGCSREEPPTAPKLPARVEGKPLSRAEWDRMREEDGKYDLQTLRRLERPGKTK